MLLTSWSLDLIPTTRVNVFGFMNTHGLFCRVFGQLEFIAFVQNNLFSTHTGINIIIQLHIAVTRQNTRGRGSSHRIRDQFNHTSRHNG